MHPLYTIIYAVQPGIHLLYPAGRRKFCQVKTEGTGIFIDELVFSQQLRAGSFTLNASSVAWSGILKSPSPTPTYHLNSQKINQCTPQLDLTPRT